LSFKINIGISTPKCIFVSNAKALGRRGGKMVILNPQPLVRDVLEKVGIDVLVPIYADFDEACAALLAEVSK
jgi:anti-anti-sigma regulatory factor